MPFDEMMYEYDVPDDGVCPNCGIGRMCQDTKPFLSLFRGNIFTIPDALTWQCDICHYYQFDYTTREVMSRMTFYATIHFYDDDQTTNTSDDQPISTSG